MHIFNFTVCGASGYQGLALSPNEPDLWMGLFGGMIPESSAVLSTTNFGMSELLSLSIYHSIHHITELGPQRGYESGVGCF